jgi:photosystem II stability/assembly factor-like uncharacterized protein
MQQYSKIILSLTISILLSLAKLSAQTTATNLYQPFSISEYPEYNKDLPKFVKLTMQPNPNFNAVAVAFGEFQKEEKEEKKEKKQQNVEEESENKYEVFYQRWQKAYEPFVQNDGTIVLPTVAEYKRKIKEANQQNQEDAEQRSAAANWVNIGPKETFWSKNDNAAQPACPWQTNIYSFDIAKTNTNILYAGPATGGIFKTIDKGLNWTPCGSNLFNFGGTADAIEIHPTDPNTVYAGVNTFIWKTTDGGATWTDLVNCAASTPNDIAISPADPNIVMVAADNGFFRSTNGGSTWTQIYTTACYDIEINPADATHVFILKNNGTLLEFFKSTNSGASFTVKSTGISTILKGRLGVTAADPNRIYALCTSSPNPPKLIKSIDEGETWTDMNATFCTATSVNDAGGGQGFYDLSIAVSQTDANQILYGLTTITKASSTDGGATYNYSFIGGYCGSFPTHPDLQEAKSIINSSGQQETWIATDGGFTLSTDFFTSASNAVARNNGIYASDFWGFGQGWNEDIMVGGRYHNGNTAMADFYPAGKALRLGAAESSTGYVLHGSSRHTAFSDLGGRILPSDFYSLEVDFNYNKFPNEGGNGQANGQSNGHNTSPLFVHPYNFKQQYVGENNVLWQTKDNGITFVSLYDFGSLIRRFDISRSNPLVMYLATDAGFYKTTNGGTAWSSVALPSPKNPANLYIAINPNNDQDVWIASKDVTSNANRVFQSIDGGSSWVNKDGTSLGTLKIKTIAHTGNGIYIAAYNNTGRVFYRSVGASDWTDFSTNLPISMDILYLKPFYRDGKLRIAGDQGIWETPLAEAVTPIAQPTVDKLTVKCARDTFYFDDYSILSHGGATWSWNFSGTSNPTYISSATVRNPKVVFGAVGTYNFSLTVSNGAGSSSKAVNGKIIISEDICGPDTIPSLAASFPGTGSDYIVSEKAFVSNNDDFSISFWMKSNDVATAARTIVGTRNVSSSLTNTNQGWAFVLRRSGTNDELHFEVGDGSAVKRVKTTFDITDDTWHYIAGTVNNVGNMELFVDGISIGTQSVATLGTISNGAQLFMGKDNNGGEVNVYPYAGQIDEVKTWNTPLGINDIREKRHLTAYFSQEPNLVNYYQFNNNTTGTLEYDRKGVNNLTFYGAATRITSTAPVGGGKFARLPVSSGGIKTFSGTDCELEFPASGTFPNGDLVVTKINLSPDQLPTAGTALNNKYWIINNYGANSTFSPLTSTKFSNLAGFATGSAANFNLYKRTSNADGATWGTSIDVADVLNSNALTFSTGSNITSFSQFTIASQTAPLPIELLNFNAKLVQEKVVIKWQVANEKTLNHYVVERSDDGKMFNFLQRQEPGSFSAIDDKPNYGTNYYRLKMVENDGSYNYSPIRSVQFEPKKRTEFDVYPNPTDDVLNIKFNSTTAQTVDFTLVNALGQTVYTYQLDSKEGDNLMYFYTKNLPSGIYTLIINQENVVSTKKIIKK